MTAISTASVAGIAATLFLLNTNPIQINRLVFGPFLARFYRNERWIFISLFHAYK
jgi:hypothetical protein